MKHVPITDLKARLSAWLERVRAGEEIGVTDRGRLIARIAPVEGADRTSARLAQLVATGRVRPPARRLPKDFLAQPRPHDREGAVLKALLRERDEHR